LRRGGLSRHALRAGEVVIAAATTLVSVSGNCCLVEVVLCFDPFAPTTASLEQSIAGSSQPVTGGKGRLPSWWDEMTPEQQAVMGPGFAPVRPEHEALQSLGTDGRTVWLDDSTEEVSSVPVVAQEDAEKWMFETQGFLIVRGVMDQQWVADALAAIEHLRHDPAHLNPPTAQPLEPRFAERNAAVGTSPKLAGTHNEQHLANIASAPQPYCAPFRRMIACPAIVQRFNWMLGRPSPVAEL
jgi:hypothetical protein